MLRLFLAALATAWCTLAFAQVGGVPSAQGQRVGPYSCSAACTTIGPNADGTLFYVALGSATGSPSVAQPASVDVDITSPGVATLTYEISSDVPGNCAASTTWTSVGGNQYSPFFPSNGASATSVSLQGHFLFDVHAACFRARVSAYTSGTITGGAFVTDGPPTSRAAVVNGNAAGNSVPTTVLPTSVASAGIVPQISGSASAALIAKATAGNLYSVYAECSAACWLMVFNNNGAPADGATTAGTASGNMQECIPIAAGGSGLINYAPGPPEVFSVAITVVISSTTCATKTASTVGFIHAMIQ